MKLNLLPTYVSKEKQNKVAIVVSVLVAAVGVAAAVYMVIVPAQVRDEIAGQIAQERTSYNNLVATSAQADKIMNDSQMLIRNITLAEQMQGHSKKYPELYNDVKRYIPSFFRIHTINAVPSGQATLVTMTGVIKTHQQYADLMLALLKNPEVVGVTRNGFQHDDPRVPALSPTDQKGKPVRPGEGPIPDDPIARLDYYISQGRVTGFTGTGGFGTTDTGARRAMPGYSEITVTMVVNRDIQTPDPRATLALQVPGAGGGGGGGGTTGGGGTQPGGVNPGTGMQPGGGSGGNVMGPNKGSTAPPTGRGE